uniref:Putative ovule protein n=1 Tax=Solanum chacoense TaxID=4108 RepID=A0A0V0GLH9_SOLCH
MRNLKSGASTAYALGFNSGYISSGYNSYSCFWGFPKWGFLCIGWLLNIFINRLQLSTFTLDDYDLRLLEGGCLYMLVCRTN